MTDELNAMQRRLDLLEATVGVIALEGEYARSWDAGDAAGWASLFTEDGVFEMIGVDGRDDVVHRGRGALEQFSIDMYAQFRGVHLMHLPAVRVETAGASSVLHFRFDYAKSSEQGHEIQEVTGTYETTYALTGHGWRIEHRVERALTRRRTASYFALP